MAERLLGSWNYEDDSPLMPIEVIGKTSSYATKAYIDTGATTVVVPEYLYDEIGLMPLGTTTVLTVGGIIAEKIYLGKVRVLEKEFEAAIICRDLPGPIKSLVGREILDNYKVCLDGLRKIVSLHE